MDTQKILMSYEKLYTKIADTLANDGYVIIEDSLEDFLADGLLKNAQNGENFKEAGISSTQNLHIDKKRRRDKIRWLDGDDKYEKEFLSFSEGLKLFLNQNLYLGLKYYEAHFAIYDIDDFYEKHLDSFKNSKNRVVTTVYYLNECQGGELVIYDNNDNVIKTVQPKKNTLVVFLSEKFPHEVRPVFSKRFSIAGWFRVDDLIGF